MKKPITRDWLSEAFEIADGKRIGVKKEHVAAAIKTVRELMSRHMQIKEFVQQAFDMEQKRRAQAGLPPIQPPPGLKGMQ